MNKDNTWFYISVAIIYISMSAAIIFGIYITRTASPLWAFLLVPAFKSTVKKNIKNKEDDEE